MVYICHKVGVTFPNCTQCETYTECEKEADKHRKSLRLGAETQEALITLTT
ncbi:MAG: hypothetical protein V1710_07425 [Candidatus Bathyarchaeota archaeon]